MEKQLNFREKQIEKLTAKCSLLQVELSSTFDVSDQKLTDSVSTRKSVQESLITKEEMVDERSEMEEEKSTEDDVKFLREVKESDIPESYPEDVLKTQKRPLKLKEKKKKYEEGLESLEASAMIISSLNHELMLLMQVL